MNKESCKISTGYHFLELLKVNLLKLTSHYVSITEEADSNLNKCLVDSDQNPCTIGLRFVIFGIHLALVV